MRPDCRRIRGRANLGANRFDPEEEIMAAESKATTVWEGALASGRGTTRVGSGALPEVEVTWPARTERIEGTTSPEELLAAAHTSCFCMALSHELAEAGNPPQRLEASTTIAFVPGEGVKSSRFLVSGRVRGIDQAGFEEAARGASENCPISQALKGNTEISVEAILEG
jgi:lipoyl-dependent peroxiredoxin